MHNVSYAPVSYPLSNRKPSTVDRSMLWLKRWIWVYFWLLIFEGVLRKWVVPGLSAQLLLIRDPIAVIIYVEAYRAGKFSIRTMWPFAVLTLTLVALVMVQIMTGNNTVLIAIYGLRSYALHLPLAVVMAGVLTEQDIRKLGRWILIVFFPMAILMMAQYSAPGSSWLNAGAGVGAGQIGSAGGHLRASGTFSFVSGTICFVPLAAGFLAYASGRKGWIPNWIAFLAAGATIAAIPATASRTVLFTMSVLVGVVVLASLYDISRLSGLLKLTVMVLVATGAVLQFQLFNDSVSTFSDRWNEASRTEGNTEDVLSTRLLHVIGDGLGAVGSAPLLGKGVGMGSNAASVLKVGTSSFLLAEMEWERVVLEFGPILGLAYMGLRLYFAAYLIWISLRALKRNRPLSLFLLPALVPLIIMGSMEQPTNLGFMVFGTGICLAAARPTRLSVKSPASSRDGLIRRMHPRCLVERAS